MGARLDDPAEPGWMLTTRGAVLALTLAFLGMWAAAAVGEALWPTPPLTPSIPAVAREETPVWTAPSLGAPDTRTSSRVAPKASRSRRPGTDGSGTLAEVSCYVWSGRRTASGTLPAVGQAAANAYRFGTKLRVEGFGVVTVTDRSAPGATDVDLFFASRRDCLSFGRRWLRVEVIR